MESDDLKKEYEQTLARYTLMRTESAAIEKQIDFFRQSNQALKAKLSQPITSIQPVIQTVSIQNLQKQIKWLRVQQETLALQCRKQQAELFQNINSHNRMLQAYQRQLHEAEQKRKTTIFTVDITQSEHLRKAMQIMKHKEQSETQRVDHVRREIEDEQRYLSDLQRQVQQLQMAKNNKSNSTTSQVQSLQNDLKMLEKQEAHLNDELKSRQQARQKVKNLCNQLDRLNSQNVHLLNRIQKINSDIPAMIQYDRNESLEKEMKKLEQAQKQINKEIESLNKELAAKRQKENLRKEEAKSEKNKNKRNFKQQIIQEQKLSQILERELERQRIKLQETMKLRKTYVNSQSLQILQKELERHQIKNKPSLQTQEAKRQKLIKERNIIKQRIEFLKNNTKRLQTQSEQNLKELRSKEDQLVKDKLANEKTLNEITSKLNEYFKEFPDHQRKKQETKNEQRRRRHQEKIKAKQQQRERDLLKKKLAMKQRGLETPDEEKGKTQWNEGNITTKGEKISIVNSKPFKLMAAAAIAIVVLWTMGYN